MHLARLLIGSLTVPEKRLIMSGEMASSSSQYMMLGCGQNQIFFMTLYDMRKAKVI